MTPGVCLHHAPLLRRMNPSMQLELFGPQPASPAARGRDARVTLAEPERLRELVRRGALVVANHSGGKDSQAMLDLLAAEVPRAQLVAIHADLSEVEWGGTMDHARDHAKALGVPFITAKARMGREVAARLGREVGAPKTFLDMVESRHRARPEAPCFPSAKHRQCTSDLKRGPLDSAIARYAAEHGRTLIVSAMGLRAAESSGRSKLAVWSRSAENSKAGREWWDYLPIHHLSRQDVFRVIADTGRRPHWAYAAGNDRLSCVFCIMGSKGDLKRGAEWNPELFAQYDEIERRTGRHAHMSNRPLRELVGMTPDEARARRRTLPVLRDEDYARLAESCGDDAGETPCARRPRENPGHVSVAPRAFRALHPDATPMPRGIEVSVPREVTGMGELLDIELGDLDDADHVRIWRFGSPRPRLGFEHVSRDARRGARVSRLWILGGAWRIDDRGRFHGAGARPSARVERVHGAIPGRRAPRELSRRYAETHGGRAPSERVTGDLAIEGGVVPVGWLRAVSYHTDKRERAERDPADYRHAFEGEARPLVCVTADGRGLVVLSDRDTGPLRYGRHRAPRFGRYTVTPHGIEDIG